MRTETVLTVLRRLVADTGTLQYVILGGNAGDALIDLGFLSLAHDNDIPYEIVPLNRVSSERAVVVSGGGGLVTEWEGARPVIELLSRTCVSLVILPQTIRGHEDLLRELGTNVTLFVREAVSHEHALSYATGGAKVMLDHDMAFNLDARAFLCAAPLRIPNVTSATNALRLCLYSVASARSMLFDTITVNRRDGERREQKKPWQIYNDLSFVSAFRGRDVPTIENTGRLLLSLIDRYSVITTNRLHVGIGGYLLGKEVHFLNNSNSKIRGVYEHSMLDAPSVTFQD